VSQVIDVTHDADADTLLPATTLLREGGLVVLPTDTVYGVAADAFQLDGTAALFRARGQDRNAPLTVFVRSPKQLIGLTPEVPEVADQLIAAFWPGPLTLVLPSTSGMRWDLGRGAGTIAIRMPLDEVALAVVREVGPLAVSAATVVGGPAPVDVEIARSQLGDTVGCYLDAGPRGELLPSTIVDLSGADPVVLRPGAIAEDLVLQVARGELDPLEAAIAATADPDDPDPAPATPAPDPTPDDPAAPAAPDPGAPDPDAVGPGDPPDRA
jgi:L-threonylcarbamoyladenylate synthase